MNINPRKQRLVSEINITPFTDVILVLLVIFMITTPLISQSSIKVKLPQANSGKAIEASKQLLTYITITTEGSVYLDEKLATKQELKDKVSTMYRNNPDLTVILRSDRLVRFKDIVEVLDILSEIGITRLDIAATKEK